MVRVSSRPPSLGRSHSAVTTARRRDKKPSYKIQFDLVTAPKKRLYLHKTDRTQPPKGYTFLAIGHADLADKCKDLSREKGVSVNVVSAKAKLNPNGPSISQHLHRVGYHFRSDIFDESCLALGYAMNGKKLFRPTTPDPAAGFERAFARYGAHFENTTQRDATSEEETKVKKAIKELFPRIPDSALDKIFRTAWREGEDKVGNAVGVPLSRRAQLATVAHIRHTYTDYDRLLKEVSWPAARAAVEKASLAKLVEWRGEDDFGDDIEDIIRETIVIDDEDAENNMVIHAPFMRGHGEESDSSVEYVSRAANADELRSEYVPEPVAPHYAQQLQSNQTRQQRRPRNDRITLQARWQEARLHLRGGDADASTPVTAPPRGRALQELPRIHVPLDPQGRAPRRIVQGEVEYVRVDSEEDVRVVAQSQGTDGHLSASYPGAETPAYRVPHSQPPYGSQMPPPPPPVAHYMRSRQQLGDPSAATAYNPVYTLGNPSRPVSRGSVIASQETPAKGSVMHNQLGLQAPVPMRMQLDHGDGTDAEDVVDLTTPPQRRIRHRQPGESRLRRQYNPQEELSAAMLPPHYAAPAYAHHQDPQYHTSRQPSPVEDVIDLTSPQFQGATVYQHAPSTYPAHRPRPVSSSWASRNNPYVIDDGDDEYDPAHPSIVNGHPSHSVRAASYADPGPPGPYAFAQPAFAPLAYGDPYGGRRSVAGTLYPQHGAPALIQPSARPPPVRYVRERVQTEAPHIGQYGAPPAYHMAPPAPPQHSPYDYQYDR